MPLPPLVDQQVRSELASIVTALRALRQRAEEIDRTPRRVVVTRQAGRFGSRFGSSIEEAHALSASENDAEADFATLRARSVHVLELLSEGAAHLRRTTDRVRTLTYGGEGVRELLGEVQAVDHSYRAGLMEPLIAQIEAAIAGDYLAQAQALLEERPAIAKHDCVPAAVLLRAVLERGLKTVGVRQVPPVPLALPSGRSKGLMTLIDDLKVTSPPVYDETRAKELRAWADVGNDAAHGDWEKGTISKESVERMRDGVRQFLKDFV